VEDKHLKRRRESVGCSLGSATAVLGKVRAIEKLESLTIQKLDLRG